MRYYYRNDNKGGIQGFENMLRYRLGLEKKFKLKLTDEEKKKIRRQKRLLKEVR